MLSAILFMVIGLRTPHPFGSPDFASTPQEAVLNIVGGAVVRTNVVGRFATVVVHEADGYLGPARGPSRADAVILVERFSFGWQPLEDLSLECRLDAHVRSMRSRKVLLRGITTGQSGHQTGCSAKPSDFGSPAEIDAVRRLETGPLVPSVVVVEDYALGGWYEQGGGPHLFKRVRGRWRLIAGTGGAADEAWLQKRDVPKRLWCPLLTRSLMAAPTFPSTGCRQRHAGRLVPDVKTRSPAMIRRSMTAEAATIGRAGFRGGRLQRARA